MSQMVLPQSLPSKAPSEGANATGPSRPGGDRSGESSFDAVSRSEQERLEAKRAEKNRQADKQGRAEAKTERPEAEKPDKEHPDTAETATAKAETPADEDPGDDSGQNLAADGSGKERNTRDLTPFLAPGGGLTSAGETSGTDSAIDSVPVTFAGLQSLLAPASGQAQSGPTPDVIPVNGQGLPLLQGSVMSVAGLNGSGKNAAMTLQASGQNGSASGMALTEALLAGVTGDGGKSSDGPILQTAIRFQGALESASAQSNAVNTPRMAPDAPPLRGYTTSIDVPVSHAEWGDKVAGKLTWLTARNMSVAEIHLTPPDMGPMEVRVQVQQDQANITVHSANPAVRDQLELHSHRLRDMLSAQGLALEKFDVSDSSRDQTRDGEAGGNGQSEEGLIADPGLDDNSPGPQSLDLSWKGEVDIFA